MHRRAGAAAWMVALLAAVFFTYSLVDGGPWAAVGSGVFLALWLPNAWLLTRRPLLEIAPEGLTTGGRTVPWHQLDAVVLERDRLLLVPTTGADVGSTGAKSPLDGRPAAEVGLAGAREPKAEIAAALHRHAGGRFTVIEAADAQAAPPIVLRGYDMGQVDTVLRRVDEALGSADPALRATVAKELSEAVFTVVLRGYDRGAVDAHLAEARRLLES